MNVEPFLFHKAAQEMQYRFLVKAQKMFVEVPKLQTFTV